MKLPSEIEKRLIDGMASHNFTKKEAIKIIYSKSYMEFCLIRELWQEIKELRGALQYYSKDAPENEILITTKIADNALKKSKERFGE